MAQQDVRYFLMECCLSSVTDYIRSVATDGHRLASSNLSQDSGNSEMKQVIVPRKGVLELQRLLGDLEGEVELSFGANHLCARSTNFTMTTKLV